jgi:hypothetical protein
LREQAGDDLYVMHDEADAQRLPAVVSAALRLSSRERFAAKE